MKKSFIALTTMLLMIGSTGIISASENEDAEGVKKFTSDVSVSFTAGEDGETPDIVDPDPSLPGEPEEGTGDKGPLSLDYVPNLPFGNHAIEGKVQVMNTTNEKPFIQVTDLRGTNSGWNVSLQLSEFTHTTDNTNKLKKAKINFNNGQVEAANGTSSAAPQTNDFTVEAGKESVTVLKANQNQGAVQWHLLWFSKSDDMNKGTENSVGNSHISLSADTSDALVGSYEATAEWTLSATPNSR